MTDEAPGFEGLFYEDANKAITEQLEAKGALKSSTLSRTPTRMTGERKTNDLSCDSSVVCIH